MPRVGMKCVRGEMTDEACRACIREHNGVTPCHVPAPFLEMMRGNDGEPDHESFTPSRLLGCFRQSALQSDPTVEWWTNVEYMWASVRGTLIHSGVEAVPWPDLPDEQVVREVRLYTEVDTKYGPQRFAGKPDTILVEFDEARKTIIIDVWDWKTREFAKDMAEADRNHQMQVWMYAWLAYKELATDFVGKEGWDVEVRSVNIAYISSSGCRIFTSLGPGVAQVLKGRGKDRHYEELALEPIKTLDLAMVGRFIRARIEAKIHAKELLPPELEGEAAKWCFRCPVVGVCRVRAAMERREQAA